MIDRVWLRLVLVKKYLNLFEKFFLSKTDNFIRLNCWFSEKNFSPLKLFYTVGTEGYKTAMNTMRSEYKQYFLSQWRISEVRKRDYKNLELKLIEHKIVFKNDNSINTILHQCCFQKITLNLIVNVGNLKTLIT